MTDKINFKTFLEENGVDTKLFAENCLSKNQGSPYWKHTDVHSLFTTQKPMNWIQMAFVWDKALQQRSNPRKGDSWYDLNCKWRALVGSNKNTVVSGFTQYSIKELYKQ